MSEKKRGVFQIIWKHFIASLKPNFKMDKLIGEDYYGTKYYEASTTVASKKYPSRYFVPVNKDDHEQEIPVEWEAWLRNRRKNPPTQEEIEKNYQIAMIKKQNAAKLKARYSSSKSEELQLPVSKKGYESFPTYEEYKDHGENYKIKHPK